MGLEATNMAIFTPERIQEMKARMAAVESAHKTHECETCGAWKEERCTDKQTRFMDRPHATRIRAALRDAGFEVA